MRVLAQEDNIVEAREIYQLAKERSLAGRAAKALVYIHQNARPPRFAKGGTPLEEQILARHLPGTARVLMLGSNVPRERLGGLGAHDVTQIDLKALPHVDVVADAERLTESFPEASFDYVISASMLEHTPHPWRVVEQVFKVIRPGGVFYLCVPWMFPLHAEPNDYWRFSAPCLKGLIADAGFIELESGCGASPHHALHTFLLTYLCEVFSRDRSAWFYSLELAFSWLLFPLGALEHKFRLGPRRNYYTDSMLYIAAKKPAA
jgi:SAM-dependent methyltransferase